LGDLRARLPSDKSLGYSRASLWDKDNRGRGEMSDELPQEWANGRLEEIVTARGGRSLLFCAIAQRMDSFKISTFTQLKSTYSASTAAESLQFGELDPALSQRDADPFLIALWGG